MSFSKEICMLKYIYVELKRMSKNACACWFTIMLKNLHVVIKFVEKSVCPFRVCWIICMLKECMLNYLYVERMYVELFVGRTTL